jgi:hypothetical protein
MNVDGLMVTMDIDTRLFNQRMDAALLLREKLKAQFSLGIFSGSPFDHFPIITESGMGRDKLGELLAVEFVRIFDSACINHCLEALKFRILINETVRQQFVQSDLFSPS